MEAGTRLISPPPASLPRIHLRSPFSTSVPNLHDQASRAVTSMQTSSADVHRFPASVLSHEQRDDCQTNNFDKEEKTVPAMLAKWRVESRRSCFDDKEKYEFDQYLRDLELQYFDQQGLSHPFPFLYAEGKPQLAMSIGQVENESDVIEDSEKQILLDKRSTLMRPVDVLALAKRAMIASRKAASFTERTNLLAAEDDDSSLPGLDHQGSSEAILLNSKATVRSNRLLERRSKKRKVSRKPKDIVYGVTSSKTKDINKKIAKALDPNDPLKLFLWGPETKQLLTVKEEKDLFVKIQDLMRLEEVQRRLRMQFDREPTLAELAEAVGMSCHVLQSCLSSGKRSREKMIYANLRLVVHLAKQYEGKGLNIQDLLQEGSKGLMKSLEKFKPKAGCRFPTYAYWWIRQSIKKAIYQNSRTIRLPENVFGLLKKIKNARRMHIEEGRLPTNEEIAKHIGITVDKLETLLLACRNPVSIQKRAWADQDTTFQEITADPEVETPDVSIAKQMMRLHVRSLLRILDSRERQIIQYRFGFYGHEPKTLTEIGMMFDLSKERVRQLESRALDKLKDSLPSQGLNAYLELLT